MREIKFRAKSLKDGEWHYGSLVKIPCTDVNGDYFDRYEIIEVTPRFPMVHYTADPSTIGEYTGFKDCNGNEIYEGDVVLCENDKITVQWERVGFESLDICNCIDPIKGIAPDRLDCVIIGNIHDRP